MELVAELDRRRQAVSCRSEEWRKTGDSWCRSSDCERDSAGFVVRKRRMGNYAAPLTCAFLSFCVFYFYLN